MRKRLNVYKMKWQKIRLSNTFKLLRDQNQLWNDKKDLIILVLPILFTDWLCTPSRTHSISGLKSQVLKLTFLALKMMVKSGLKFILKFIEPLQRYLLTCQANKALMGRFFGTGQQQRWRGSVNFKIKPSRPLFTTILSQKCKFQDSRF